MHRKLDALTIQHAPTLTVFRNGTPICTRYGTWRHPLFALEAYRAAQAVQPDQLLLQDNIIEKAAALRIPRLGVSHRHSG